MIFHMFAAAAVAVLGLGAPEQPFTDEVVVMGKKLELTQGVIKTNVVTGKSRCTVEKSSGDARVDKAVCDIAIACLQARKDGPAFRPCVLDGRRRFLAELTEAQESKDQ